MTRTITMLLLLFVLPFSLRAEIYKWVDEHGNTHYGDKPVEQSEQIQVDIEKKGHLKTTQGREDRRRKLVESMEEDRIRKEEEKAEEIKQRNRRKRQCVVAQDRLKAYERAGYLYDLDKDGNRVIVSKEDRQKVTEALRKNIAKNCK